ncbi:MAG: GNAT family N-acetyltransferase [Gemmatimonadales bacterium]
MRLRLATFGDARRLLDWANDPGTRAASGGRDEIPWDRHLQWLASRLQDDSALVFVGESAVGEAVGSIRFETEDGWRSAVLSYVVAPDSRGRGFGRALLVEGVAAIRRIHPAAVLGAEVQLDNPRSVRLFESLGWDVGDRDEVRIRFLERSGVPA